MAQFCKLFKSTIFDVIKALFFIMVFFFKAFFIFKIFQQCIIHVILALRFITITLHIFRFHFVCIFKVISIVVIDMHFSLFRNPITFYNNFRLR